SGSTAGMVIGIVFAVAVLITAAVGAFVVIRRRRNARDPPLILNSSYDASTCELTLLN
ncbi:hypothetical protein MTO96_038920, partial [Rhipicephalus appendiculatus]